MGRLKTPIPKRLPTPFTTDAAERQYFRFLHKYAQAYIRLMREGLDEILPQLRETAAEEQPVVRQDAYSVSAGITRVRPAYRVSRMDANVEKKVREVMSSVEAELEALFPTALLRRWAQSMVGSVNKTGKKNIKRLAGKVGLEVEPLLHDRELNPYFENFVDENVGLIRSIPLTKMASFKNGLVYAITSDMPVNQLQRLIQDNFKTTKGRAALLARDQVGKLNAQVNQHRQQQLGGKRYVWRTAKDERVTGKPGGRYPNAKPSHWKRDGETYFWSKPPEGGHPGKRVRCRCRAEMVVEDILD